MAEVGRVAGVADAEEDLAALRLQGSGAGRGGEAAPGRRQAAASAARRALFRATRASLGFFLARGRGQQRGTLRAVIDPLERWREYGEKPDFAGLLTFAGMPYTEDPAELAGVDVAIVGAPTDDLVSDRPGTRFGPRAIRAASCPPGPHLEAGVDALRASCASSTSATPRSSPPTRRAPTRRSSARSARCSTPARCRSSSAATTAIAEPDIRACAARHGPVGLVHFDTHTDTGAEVFGVEVSHGTPMHRLVEAGHVDPGRYVQIGLRGYWPGEEEFAWQAERGIVSIFMHDVRELRHRRGRRARRSPTSARARSSSRSTSTSSTRPSRPAPARPSRAG